MGHPFPVREIALQAGVSEATVDRVLNRRGGVRASTMREVERAVAELHRQQTQLRLTGRTFIVDVVMQAPARFSSQVRTALEEELPLLRPAVIRARFHLTESGPATDLVATLDGIGRRGSKGVVLKAPDLPEVRAAVERLVDRGVPVVTLVTDLPTSRRVAYVGIDNAAAGATAAYLVRQWLGDRPGSILLTLSSETFHGEEEREEGFRTAMQAADPSRRLVAITETDGLDAALRTLVRDALGRHPDLCAVYSIGGGNVATVETFAAAGRDCAVLVAHDLDEDNLRLLQAGHVSAVLHHDLRLDARRACQELLRWHGALPHRAAPVPSGIQVVTPHNVPARLGRG